MCGKTTLEHYEPVWNMLQRTPWTSQMNNITCHSTVQHGTTLHFLPRIDPAGGSLWEQLCSTDGQADDDDDEMKYLDTSALNSSELISMLLLYM